MRSNVNQNVQALAFSACSKMDRFIGVSMLIINKLFKLTQAF